MNMKTEPEKWELGASRAIKTPNGEFYLTYGQDGYGNPKFKDFCKLDRIAHQVANLPVLTADLARVMEAKIKVTKERDKLAEVLKPFATLDHGHTMSEPRSTCKYCFARAALAKIGKE